MSSLPTLRRELIAAFALVFVGGFVVATTGIILMLPRFDTPTQAAIYVSALLIFDVAIFGIFGHVLITRRILDPIDRLVAGAEAIADGQMIDALPDAETVEMTRL